MVAARDCKESAKVRRKRKALEATAGHAATGGVAAGGAGGAGQKAPWAHPKIQRRAFRWYRRGGRGGWGGGVAGGRGGAAPGLLYIAIHMYVHVYLCLLLPNPNPHPHNALTPDPDMVAYLNPSPYVHQCMYDVVPYHHHHHHHQKAFRNKSHTSHGHRPGLKRNKSKGKRLTIN